jgi:UDP-N-acetylmuramate: L-alanyl-gamma-D-glutamyl-meso-diaminopimelate ligase
MHLHVLGVAGTFMGGVALLARELGHTVTGSDRKVYPPMNGQLAAHGIAWKEGYHPAHLEPRPDLVLVGNALSRGNPLVEAVLDARLPYTSGAQWVAENVLPGRWVLACAGTHGKTTTASLLAWILESAGLEPGFLIGGVPENFGVSARLGGGRFFVIEADEYDTAFFDKRSKFVHYRPHTAVLANLEYDHADIFPDLAAVMTQFHHFVRTVPSNGLLVVNGRDKNLAAVLAMGCWTPVERFDARDGWEAELLKGDASRFRVRWRGADQGEVEWGLIGTHNVQNALAALAAARHAGVPAATALAALRTFRHVKRRLEVRGAVDGITVYDDFAHHPTAIAATLAALRARVGDERIVAVLELRSNTMRLGVHRDTLAPALSLADQVLLLRPPGINWNLERVTAALGARGAAYPTVEDILEALGGMLRPRDHVLIMSNGDFGNIHARLLEQLETGGERRKAKDASEG